MGEKEYVLGFFFFLWDLNFYIIHSSDGFCINEHREPPHGQQDLNKFGLSIGLSKLILSTNLLKEFLIDDARFCFWSKFSYAFSKSKSKV